MEMFTRDFTVDRYSYLLTELIEADYQFMSVERFLSFEGTLTEKIVILRHDVDKRPKNALAIASLESQFGISATYYFRAVPCSFDREIIESIIQLGHELGYHYEDLTLTRGDYEAAYQLYKKNILSFRELYPIRTVCMHGSPLSRWKNSDLWRKYCYKVEGIIGEPYFDIDYDDFSYLNDTGRTWADGPYVIRDRVPQKQIVNISSTQELMTKIKTGELPARLVINTHPQRWHNSYGWWALELIGQSMKNLTKVILGRINAQYRFAELIPRTESQSVF